ncbi:hypothetical protein ACIA8G_09115 [Lentzea sp. NPDC051213]|uniref:hypothetical protein n=1 Tax=Lentzea sp. NPDC051213 TaxID=3364126 RepID=UPI00379B7D90
MGLRKVVLAVVVGLATLFIRPAVADPGEPCSLWERQVYAITTTGGLVEHGFCLEANRTVSRWAGERVVATSGWGEVSQAFWSGTVHGTGVYYRVDAGVLQWSSDLQSWQRIGAWIDWSTVTSLTSAEPGVIYGTEPSGKVRKWVHLGWQDGTDTWGRTSVVGTLPPASALLGQTRDGFIGIDGTGLGDVVHVWPEGFATTSFRISVPPGVERGRLVPFDLQQRYPNSAFALTSAGRLALLLPVKCEKLDRAWRADDETGGGYRQIFAGGYVEHGTGPVEWQCTGPGKPGN